MFRKTYMPGSTTRRIDTTLGFNRALKNRASPGLATLTSPFSLHTAMKCPPYHTTTLPPHCITLHSNHRLPNFNTAQCIASKPPHHYTISRDGNQILPKGNIGFNLALRQYWFLYPTTSFVQGTYPRSILIPFPTWSCQTGIIYSLLWH